MQRKYFIYYLQYFFYGLTFRALEALVNFAYSGKVILDKNNVQSIMIGASYLQLNKVRDACANYLLQR